MTMCSVAGCVRRAKARGWCNSHYMNWYRYGDPEHVHERVIPDNRIPVATRFWSKADLSEPDGCWPWIGSRRHEYGEVWVNGAKHYAHRVAWQLVNHRQLMPDEVVRHTCDNQVCVRPDHLLVGSQGENVADMAAAGRWRNQHAAGPNNDPTAWPTRRGTSERERRRIRKERKQRKAAS